MAASRTPWPLVAVLLLSITEVTDMAQAETWVLSSDPIPDDEVVATLDLFHEERTMGQETTHIVHAPLTVGRSAIFRPPGTAETAAEASRWAHYLVTVPFTLHPLSRGRGYDRVEVHVQLDDRQATAFRLYPDEVLTKEDVSRTWSLSADLAKAGVGVGGKGDYKVAFEHLRPALRSFGIDQPDFYWTLKRQRGSPELLGSRRFVVLLKVPRETAAISASLFWTADVDSLLGALGLQPVKTGRLPLTWRLDEAEPPSAIFQNLAEPANALTQ